MSKIIKVKTCDLVTDGLQTRKELDSEAVKDYTENYLNGTAMPPVSVVEDTETDEYYLVDGFHRMAASVQAGLDELAAEVVAEGDRAVALRLALKANQTNGLRRTNADKRAALEIAWANRKFLFEEEPSRRQLADICGVSHTFVNNSYDSVVETVSTREGMDSGDEETSSTQRSVKKLLKEGKDRFGQNIPEKIIGAFKSGELMALVRMVLKCIAFLKGELKKKNPAFAKVIQQTLQNLENAARHLRFARAYCVCPLCNGDGCHSCDELGWLNKEQHDRLPSELKPKIRTAK